MQAAEREAARAAWEATPKRLRGRVLACCVCFRGVAMSVSVHEFPDRKGSAVFRFYAPLYAATMEIALSFTVIGTAIGLKKDDILSEWTDFEKMSYYRRVINKMSLTTSPDMVGAQRAKRRLLNGRVRAAAAEDEAMGRAGGAAVAAEEAAAAAARERRMAAVDVLRAERTRENAWPKVWPSAELMRRVRSRRKVV